MKEGKKRSKDLFKVWIQSFGAAVTTAERRELKWTESNKTEVSLDGSKS